MKWKKQKHLKLFDNIHVGRVTDLKNKTKTGYCGGFSAVSVSPFPLNAWGKHL